MTTTDPNKKPREEARVWIPAPTTLTYGLDAAAKVSKIPAREIRARMAEDLAKKVCTLAESMNPRKTASEMLAERSREMQVNGEE